jgi:hypothetical protein
MNLLRAFGAYIGNETPDQENSIPRVILDQPVSSTPIETEIPHCCFYCLWCGSAMMFPHDSLGHAFGGPMIRKIETRCIGTVCQRCERVAAYSLFRGCPGYDTRHKFMQARAVGRTMLLDWLACVEKSCVFPLPFFVTFNDSLTEENVIERAAQWLWDDLNCSVSHVIHPPQWLHEPGLYRRPLDLNRAGAQRAR